MTGGVLIPTGKRLGPGYEGVTMMPTAKVRKAIYALSAVLIPLLVVIGMEAQAAAVWVAAGLGVANVVMAFLNVPEDDDDA